MMLGANERRSRIVTLARKDASVHGRLCNMLLAESLKMRTGVWSDLLTAASRIEQVQLKSVA
jgi:hypothetical protein